MNNLINHPKKEWEINSEDKVNFQISFISSILDHYELIDELSETERFLF